MLEKLATHDMETVHTLFALADKCARAAEFTAKPRSTAVHTLPEAAVHRSSGRSRDRGPGRPQQTPTTAEG
jgi:hypothetical protein